MNKKYFALIIIFFWLFPFSVFATAVSVKPQKLEITSYPVQESTGEILIANISNEPAIYEVYPDSYVKNIKINPKEFRLAPGETQIVKVVSRFWLNGQYEFDLSIVSRSLNSVSVATAAGVKLSVVVFVAGRIIWTVLLGIIILLLVISYWVRKKPRK
jgi:hypothetical protein